MAPSAPSPTLDEILYRPGGDSEAVTETPKNEVPKHQYGEGYRRYMISMSPDVMDKADQYWRKKGFVSRSAFLRFLMLREIASDGDV